MDNFAEKKQNLEYLISRFETLTKDYPSSTEYANSLARLRQELAEHVNQIGRKTKQS